MSLKRCAGDAQRAEADGMRAEDSLARLWPGVMGERPLLK